MTGTIVVVALFMFLIGFVVGYWMASTESGL